MSEAAIIIPNSTPNPNSHSSSSDATNPPKQTQSFKCDLCNITCNTIHLLHKHQLGRKHLKTLQNPTATAPKLVPPVVAELVNNKADPVYCHLCKVVCNNQEIYQKHLVGKKHSAKAIIQLATTTGILNATSYSVNKPNAFQCELCNITCTSSELLNTHLAGKKHLRKLKESGQIPKMPLTTMVNPESVNVDGNNINGKRVGSHEDVESKRQKILQGGAALNAIRTCTLCNVVCNSPTVFDAHIGGQKHAAMAAKQVEASTGEKS